MGFNFHRTASSGNHAADDAETTLMEPVAAPLAPPDPSTRVDIAAVPPVDSSSSGGHGGGRHGRPGKPKKPWYLRWWVWLLAVLFVIGGASYALTPSAMVPNVVGMNATDAKAQLEANGFREIKLTPTAAGKESLWMVRSQSPADGKHKTSDPVTLTIVKDLTGIAGTVQAGMTLSDATAALDEAGYTDADYAVTIDSGGMVTDTSRYVIVSVQNGDPPTLLVHDQKADEEAAAAKAQAEADAAKKAEEEEVARKAAEEEAAKQKAAEEEVAKQKAAEEEAARKKAAEEQAAQQKAEQAQKQSTSKPSTQSSQGSGSSSGGSSSGGSSNGGSSGGSSFGSNNSGGSGVLVAVCKDGTRSTSSPGAKDYRGMCSSHGGIAQKLGRQ